MGRDKALVPVHGVPMAARVRAAMLDAGCAEVVAIGGESAALVQLGFRVVPDEFPGEGPLGGVITALAGHPGAEAVVVVACDLPALRGASVRSLMDGLGAFDVAVARGDRLQPVCAVWRPRVEGELRALFAAGERRLLTALAGLQVVEIDIDPQDLANVNTPSDLPPVAFVAMSITEASVADLERALVEGARVVDVRELDEYVDGHVPGAVHVALGTVPQHVAAFEGVGTTYVICKAGGRSMRACEFLAQQGIETVNVTGGMLDWVAGGRPVVTGATPL